MILQLLLPVGSDRYLHLSVTPNLSFTALSLSLSFVYDDDGNNNPHSWNCKKIYHCCLLLAHISLPTVYFIHRRLTSCVDPVEQARWA